MTKRELIEKLEQLDCPDETPVNLFDHRMNMHDDAGDGSTKGVYTDYEFELMNKDMPLDEKEYFLERHGYIPKVWVAISFTNEHFEE